ncbi:hypothetical protein ROZALSC1DRAFT_26490 [Rozella allomycis CSF55]|uniref:Uncharacterized protein n=1 Tax=Rozella allomycis (strain CSF55) TaxID=988480 RepID=A0A075B0Q3_ROZAC|nr:hypothetical protein O9G_003892 [Rozella allomycis CSF55]RKP22107.1 hypothetical protein ROZALSC1DRAFT_26490 [Rozella allomycis CSF55]|eukprot:EPZ35977.1 hypothetical protein O9G_003892 [Rozella allomycis CSF55]
MVIHGRKKYGSINHQPLKETLRFAFYMFFPVAMMFYGNLPFQRHEIERNEKHDSHLNPDSELEELEKRRRIAREWLRTDKDLSHEEKKLISERLNELSSIHKGMIRAKISRDLGYEIDEID